MKKTIFETIPELSSIARELNVKINDAKVLEEYFIRHPEERKENIKCNQNTNK